MSTKKFDWLKFLLFIEPLIHLLIIVGLFGFFLLIMAWLNV